MKSVIVSSLILISSLFLYVACGEKPDDEATGLSTSTPPVPPATCEDITLQTECGAKALANNVAATNCMWNAQINPQKCITRALDCVATAADNCGTITPLDNKICELDAITGDCVEKPPAAAAKPATCEDILVQGECGAVALANALADTCMWNATIDPQECITRAADCASTTSRNCLVITPLHGKDCKLDAVTGDCVDKVKVKLEKIPTTCDQLLETDCGTKSLKKRPANTCAWNNNTTACVERKSTCQNTSQADCGFVRPTNDANCKLENNICVENVDKPNSCDKITDLTKCGSTALKNAKANTCAPNNVSKKCVTRAANCKTTQKDDCGEVIPLDTKACEYSINKCQEKVVINKCDDIKNDAGKCNKTTLGNGKKCAYHNKNKVCVEKADDCSTTLQANCGHITPTDGTNCFYYPTGKNKRCMRIPEKCENILIQDLCTGSKTKYNLAFECSWANNKCSPKK